MMKGNIVPLVLLGAVGATATYIGTPSYWQPSTAVFDQIPASSLALINPENGIYAGEQTTNLSSQLSSFLPIVPSLQARSVIVQGYVPTGYFNHSADCNIAGVCQTLTRIEAQIQAYYQQFPTLDGIFFDEVSPSVYNCSDFAPEYARLRTLAQSYGGAHALLTYNTASADLCAVAAANRNEMVVLFEDLASNYPPAGRSDLVAATNAARAAGVKSWHIVNTAPDLAVLLPSVAAYAPDYFYATNIGANWQAGDNTYGEPPTYWASEIAAFPPNDTTTTTTATATSSTTHASPSSTPTGTYSAARRRRAEEWGIVLVGMAVVWLVMT
ncbi:hypothetical protein HKX48_009244 [Thoreauomyces humboldtii]|nr:hypothetical protein HKX48_009244 [Thoreauomyces humboldtii]